jgi:phospholipid/cholesterol/gamma-HCH transport system ATP-binding protein
MTRVKLDGISKKFGAVTALNEVSLSLEAGRSLALIGPTAAGKSVLLKCLVGLYAPDSGTISIDGAPVGTSQQRSNALNKRIGMLFQQNACSIVCRFGRISPFV